MSHINMNGYAIMIPRLLKTRDEAIYISQSVAHTHTPPGISQ